MTLAMTRRRLLGLGLGVLAVSLLTSIESARATRIASPTGNERLCNDNSRYRSKWGVTCSQHEGFDCQQFVNAGFSQLEVDELIQSCPHSCRVGGCIGSSREAQVVATTELLLQNVGSKDAIKVSSGRKLQLTGNSCDPSCPDDSTYISKIGLACADHSQFQCPMFLVLGYDEAETAELIRRCPCTCAVECSQSVSTIEEMFSLLTANPTVVPSFIPTTTPTMHPTIIPSLEPTIHPTSVPSRNPTHPPSSISPKVRPTIEATNAPTTRTNAPISAPTAGPAMANPTLKPSRNPTIGDITPKPSMQPSTKARTNIPNEWSSTTTPTHSSTLGRDHSESSPPPLTTTPTTTNATNTSDIVVPQTISDRAMPPPSNDTSTEKGNSGMLISIKQLVIICAGFGGLAFVTGIAFHMARRKRRAKEIDDDEELVVEIGHEGHRHGKAKGSNSTTCSSEVASEVQYYTYINKTVRNNRTVVNFETGQNAWSSRNPFSRSHQKTKEIEGAGNTPVVSTPEHVLKERFSDCEGPIPIIFSNNEEDFEQLTTENTAQEHPASVPEPASIPLRRSAATPTRKKTVAFQEHGPTSSNIEANNSPIRSGKESYSSRSKQHRATSKKGDHYRGEEEAEQSVNDDSRSGRRAKRGTNDRHQAQRVERVGASESCSYKEDRDSRNRHYKQNSRSSTRYPKGRGHKECGIGCLDDFDLRDFHVLSLGSYDSFASQGENGAQVIQARTTRDDDTFLEARAKRDEDPFLDNTLVEQDAYGDDDGTLPTRDTYDATRYDDDTLYDLTLSTKRKLLQNGGAWSRIFKRDAETKH